MLELHYDISSLVFLSFFRCVLLDEVFNVHEATSDSNHDLIALANLNEDALMAKLVHTFRFSNKHDI